jgi:hypothetical protein
MTPTIETAIWLAMKQRIDSLPLPFPVAMPGQTFTPTYSGSSLSPYIRAGRVTAAPIRNLIDNGQPHTRTGFIMLTLVHPLGPDMSVFDEYAGNIAAHFADGTQMRYGAVCVTIPRYPHAMEGYEDSGYWAVPVRIPWRCTA